MKARVALSWMFLWILVGAVSAASKPDVGAGRVAWFDLTTTNLESSRNFYGKLFGWTFTAVKGTDRAIEIVAGDLPQGTIRVEKEKPGTSSGVVYIQVDDIAASVKKAKELGGTVPEGFPFDLPDGAGAIALVIDPVGHPIGMYSRTPTAPARK